MNKTMYEIIVAYEEYCSTLIGETFVNLILVHEGYAWAVAYPPDVMYSSELADAERSARDNNRGCLWSYPFWIDSRGYLQVGCFITLHITL